MNNFHLKKLIIFSWEVVSIVNLTFMRILNSFWMTREFIKILRQELIYNARKSDVGWPQKKTTLRHLLNLGWIMQNINRNATKDKGNKAWKYFEITWVQVLFSWLNGKGSCCGYNRFSDEVYDWSPWSNDDCRILHAGYKNVVFSYRLT